MGIKIFACHRLPVLPRRFVSDADRLQWNRCQERSPALTRVSGLAYYYQSYDVYVYLDADDQNSNALESIRRISDGSTCSSRCATW